MGPRGTQKLEGLRAIRRTSACKGVGQQKAHRRVWGCGSVKGAQARVGVWVSKRHTGASGGVRPQKAHRRVWGCGSAKGAQARVGMGQEDKALVGGLVRLGSRCAEHLDHVMMPINDRPSSKRITQAQNPCAGVHMGACTHTCIHARKSPRTPTQNTTATKTCAWAHAHMHARTPAASTRSATSSAKSSANPEVLIPARRWFFRALACAARSHAGGALCSYTTD